MPKSARIAALLIALALPLAAADEAAAQESSAITTIYESVLSGVTGSVTSAGIGWAMSAIGLAGGDDAALSEIASELQAIDQDLMAIENTLVQLLNAIDNQTCVDTETQTSLTEAVDNITTLFTNYQTQFIQPSQAGDPIIPSQLDAWMTAVFDETNGMEASLTAINDAVYLNPSNVLLECIQSITQNYNSGDGPSENVFGDLTYYTPILNTINYYYGVQVQGASMLVEALHLQACQQAATSDPDLNCDFATVSTSTSPSEAYEICNDPTGVVATLCDEATEVMTDPETGTGMYDQVLAQMIYAGAPYSGGDVGLLWGTSYLFATDLLDFTDNATVDGKPPNQQCQRLESSNPCGILVGPYDLTLKGGLAYAGYPGDGESSVWKAADAEQLLALLAPYNQKSTAGSIDTSGTLADYLTSIGFERGGGNGWIITTANTGTNPDTGSEAICFMDTSISRADAAQPFCDGIAGEVESTDHLLRTAGDTDVDLREAQFTKGLASNPQFYTAQFEDQEWKIEPGWLVEAQETSDIDEQAIFWQFHYPVIDVTELDCSVRSEGNINLGGEYTRCGSDLQAYIDAVMPPPETGTTGLAAAADATLHRDDRNLNDGAGRSHQLVPLHADDSNDVVIAFSEKALAQFLDGAEVASATLRLTVDAGASDADAWRQQITVRPLPEPFAEGNGDAAALDRGTGTGATWYCAEDGDVSDQVRDCAEYWRRYRWHVSRWSGAQQLEPEEVVDDEGGAVVRMRWDVTENVADGIHAWILRRRRDQHGGSLAVHAREGAADLRDPTRAPTLLLSR